MPNTSNNNRGSPHEQHVKAGQQSHKNDDNSSNSGRDNNDNGSNRGGTHEQHVKAGQQSHKNSSMAHPSPVGGHFRATQSPFVV